MLGIYVQVDEIDMAAIEGRVHDFLAVAVAWRATGLTPALFFPILLVMLSTSQGRPQSRKSLNL